MGQYSWEEPQIHLRFGGPLSQAVKRLIVINVAIFILVRLVSHPPWIRLFGLVPSLVFAKLMIWQLVTYMFLHGGLWHLLVNMLMLWFFGCDVERQWGARQFLSYYLLTGIGAGLCSYLTAVGSPIPVVGASGAIFGIMVAYALMFPDRIVLLFFLFPMKVKHAVLLFAGVNLLGALSNPGSGIAYFAHLGGALVGYLYLKGERIRALIPRQLKGLAKERARRQARRRAEMREMLDREVDRILEKISEQGMDSLTKEEKKILQIRSTVDREEVK